NKIIHVDLSYLVITPAIADTILDECERIARTCRRKPYILSDWLNTKLTLEGAEHYKGRIPSLAMAVAGVYRFNLAENIVRVVLSSLAMTNKQKDANIYETREAALAAIRVHRKAHSRP